MRISDWSSDVCSSDLFAPAEVVSAAGRDNPTAESLRRDIGFSPRMQNGQVTGLVLSPKGAGFQNAGFQSGDIVTQVNGRPIRSAGDLQALQNQIVPGARISLMVERGAAVVPIALTLQGQCPDISSKYRPTSRLSLHRKFRLHRHSMSPLPLPQPSSPMRR